MLVSVPAAKDDKDLYLLSAALHGRDDADYIKVLRNLTAASAGTGARIALMELVVADLNADFSSAAFDMQMFMAPEAGKERLQNGKTFSTDQDWRLKRCSAFNHSESYC